MQKYGDPKVNESPFDAVIFNPIGAMLVDPLHHLGFNPNQVTYLSTFFQVLSPLLLYTEQYGLAAIVYLIGYTIDCIDGKMARKYKQTSNYGMALDFNSDMITHAALLSVSLSFMVTSFHIEQLLGVLTVLVFIYLDNLYYGVIEATSLYQKTEQTNFYQAKWNQLESETELRWFYDLFLLQHKGIYQQYFAWMGGEYSPDRHQFCLRVLKYFGPGTNCMVIAWYVYTLQTGMFTTLANIDYTSLLVISTCLSYYAFYRYGANYYADDFIHISGLVMGVLVTIFSTNKITYCMGVVLGSFHLFYELAKFVEKRKDKSE